MAIIGNIAVNLTAKTDQLEKGLNKASSSLSRWASQVPLIRLGIAGGIALAARQAYLFGKASVGAFADAESAANGLAASLKRFGNEGQFAELIDIASKIQNATTFDDESAMRAQTRLIQLTDLRGKALRDVIPAAVGLSAVMDSDLNTSFEAMAKAIQGNFGQFSKLGIVFADTATDQEKLNQVIAAGLSSYDVATAKIHTLSGAWQQLKNSVNDTMEGVGEGASQFLIDLIGVFNPAAGAGGLVAPAIPGPGSQPLVKIKRTKADIDADFAAASAMGVELDKSLSLSDKIARLELRGQIFSARGMHGDAAAAQRQIENLTKRNELETQFRDVEKEISEISSRMPFDDAGRHSFWNEAMAPRFALRDELRGMMDELENANESAEWIENFDSMRDAAHRFAMDARTDFESVTDTLQEAFDLVSQGFLDSNTFDKLAQKLTAQFAVDKPASERISFGDFSPRAPLALERGGFNSEFIKTATDQLGQLKRIEKNTRNRAGNGLTIGA